MIQTSALSHIHKINPQARWWIKADATDIKAGLRESVKKEWSGDVDWGDGQVKDLHEKYLAYLHFARNIGGKPRHTHALIKADLQRAVQNFPEELLFLH